MKWKWSFFSHFYKITRDVHFSVSTVKQVNWHTSLYCHSIMYNPPFCKTVLYRQKNAASTTKQITHNQFVKSVAKYDFYFMTLFWQFEKNSSLLWRVLDMVLKARYSYDVIVRLNYYDILCYRVLSIFKMDIQCQDILNGRQIFLIACCVISNKGIKFYSIKTTFMKLLLVQRLFQLCQYIRQ